MHRHNSRFGLEEEDEGRKKNRQRGCERQKNSYTTILRESKRQQKTARDLKRKTRNIQVERKRKLETDILARMIDCGKFIMECFFLFGGFNVYHVPHKSCMTKQLSNH